MHGRRVCLFATLDGLYLLHEQGGFVAEALLLVCAEVRLEDKLQESVQKPYFQLNLAQWVEGAPELIHKRSFAFCSNLVKHPESYQNVFHLGKTKLALLGSVNGLQYFANVPEHLDACQFRRVL